MTQTAARTLKRTAIGQSRTVLCLMYRIDSIRQVVTMTATTDLILKCKTVNTVNRTILCDAPTRVLRGTTLHFIESDDLPGWYYVGRVDHDRASCTCSAHQNKLPCKHQPLILQAHQERALRVSKDIAAEYVAAIEALENVPTLSGETITVAPEMPTFPTTSLHDALLTASPEEHSAIWEEAARREKQRKLARVAAYWKSVEELKTGS